MNGRTITQLSATFERITPDKAALFLESSTGNRPIRKWWVESIAQAIKRGEWITTHQGIAFSQSGRFLDGHHRCMAIVSANTPINMLVVRGIDDAAFTVLDCGIKRNVSDLTALPRYVADVSALAARVVFPANKPTSQQVMAMAGNGVGELAERLHARAAKTRAFFSSAPMKLAAIAQVMDGHSEEYVFELYASLVTQNYGAMPPALHLLCRQVTSGAANAVDKNGTLARGLKVFDIKNANLQKLYSSPEQAIEALNHVRAVLKRAMK